jgi:hypothetical protein
MQIVPAIADRVGKLTVFQRTPPWVTPFEKFQLPIDYGARYLLNHFPMYRSWYFLKLYWQFGDKVLDSLRKDPSWPDQPSRGPRPLGQRNSSAMEPLLLSGLKDKSALVVGGGFGMGRATARLLSANAARVYVPMPMPMPSESRRQAASCPPPTSVPTSVSPVPHATPSSAQTPRLTASLSSESASYVTGQTLLVDGGAGNYVQLWTQQ